MSRRLPRIFVAIASYRDPECQWTLKDMYAKAARPGRVNVGVCWQFDSERDLACFVEPYPRPAQIRTLEVPAAQTRGACWAKVQALSLRQGEEFVLLIDSHMRFAPGWDEQMLEMLRGIGSQRAFLSTYPAGYEPPDRLHAGTPRLVPVKFFQRVLSQNSVLLDMPRPMPSYLVAGGFVFAPAAMFDEVPYDPHIYFIGEEICHAARFYTYGWDGHTPHLSVIHHYYTRGDAARHWADAKEGWVPLNEVSYRRVRHILDIERTSDPDALRDIDRYGLGTVRTLEQFQAAIGVNLRAQLIDRSCHDSLAAIEASLASPRVPQSRHDAAHLCVLACRTGQLLVPRLDAYISRSLAEYGEWTEGVNRLLARLANAGDTVVEVGAGFGVRTVTLARLTGPGGRVFAIEQSRRLARLVQANLALNAIDHVEVLVQRAAAQPGAWVVHEPDLGAEGNHGVVAAEPMKGWRAGYTPAAPLDHLQVGRLRLLMVDAPGAGLEVLLGALGLLETHRPIVVLNADDAADAGRCQALLASRPGYSLWRLHAPFFEPTNWAGRQNNVFEGLASACLVALPEDQDLSACGATRA
jgi:FkbM family methyltransferase